MKRRIAAWRGSERARENHYRTRLLLRRCQVSASSQSGALCNARVSNGGCLRHCTAVVRHLLEKVGVDPRVPDALGRQVIILRRCP